MSDRTLGIEVDQQTLRSISRVLQAVKPDFTKIGREIRLAVLADVDERFASAPSTTAGGVVYGGVFWPALSDSYLDQRFFDQLSGGGGKNRDQGQLLRDTGELQQSFTASGAVYRASYNEVIVGTSLPKARGLQFGVFWGQSRPERARPILFVHDELANQVAEIIGLYFEREMRKK